MKIEQFNYENFNSIIISGCADGVEILTKNAYNNLMQRLDQAETELNEAKKELQAKESIQRQLEDDLERTKGMLQESRLSKNMFQAMLMFATMATEEFKEQKKLEYSKGVIRGAGLGVVGQLGSGEYQDAVESVQSYKGENLGGMENFIKTLLVGMHPDKKFFSEKLEEQGLDTMLDDLFKSTI